MTAVLIAGMFRPGPVRVRVLFFPVRVVPSGPGFNFSGPVRSGFQQKSGPGFHLRSGFHFFPARSGFHFQYFLFINGLLGWN